MKIQVNIRYHIIITLISKTKEGKTDFFFLLLRFRNWDQHPIGGGEGRVENYIGYKMWRDFRRTIHVYLRKVVSVITNKLMREVHRRGTIEKGQNTTMHNLRGRQD